MFETLEKATLDKIFVLMAEYAADPRDGQDRPRRRGL